MMSFGWWPLGRLGAVRVLCTLDAGWFTVHYSGGSSGKAAHPQ